MASSSVKCLNIGMYGCGTVGTGVYNILVDKAANFQQLYGLELKITRICARDITRPRPDLKLQKYTSFTSNIEEIINDASIQCVLELIGGTTTAKEIVYQCIQKGKHLITANKALVANNMDGLIDVLHQNPSVQFGCEAAVCGGIPIINTIQESYIGDEITEVTGILNGTTNYMLSKMESTKAQYEDVLKEAQELGYAEADPTADVDGYDAQAKIAILCKLAFGVTMPLDKIYTLGIRKIKPEDFEYAQMLKSSIKLLGMAKVIPSDDNNSENKKVIAYVSPMIVSLDSIISKTTGARNMVHILSKNCGKSALLGEGAGRYPTANSVVNDILQIARYNNKSNASNPLFSSSLSKYTIVSDYPGQFYIRVTVTDGLGIIAKMGKLASDNAISIYAILQAPITDPKRVDFVITTERTYLRNVKAMCDDISKESFVLEDPLYLPIH